MLLEPVRAKKAPVVVLDGYGASINVEDGYLVIRDGFGPKADRGETRFARGRTSLNRIVVRSPADAISFAALDWCHRMEIPIAVIGSDSRLLSCHISTPASDGPLKRAQAVAAVTEHAIPIAQQLLRKKFEAQLHAINVELPSVFEIAPNGESVSTAFAEIQRSIDALPQDENLAVLLSREGYAARIYRGMLIGRPVPWRDWTKARLPNHWLRISLREFGAKEKVRDATDPSTHYSITTTRSSKLRCA
jgi:CRISPR/Cas system-associated endonuclease Cas1